MPDPTHTLPASIQRLIRPAAVLAVFGAFVGGVWHGVGRHEAAVAAARDARATGEGAEGGPGAPGATAAPAEAPAEDLARLESMRGEAKRLAEAGAYEDGRATLQRAIEALAPYPGPRSRRLRFDLEREEVRLRILAGLRAAVTPNAFVGRSDLVDVELDSGRIFTMRVLKEEDGVILLQRPSGVELRFQRASIRAIEPCPPSRWRERVEARAAELRAAAADRTPLGLFRLAHYLLENGIEQEARPLLEAAVEADRSGLLAETFCDPTHRPGPRELALLGQDEPHPSDLAAAPSPGAEGGPPSTPSGLPSRPDYDMAVRSIERGVGHFRRAFAGEGSTAAYEREQAIKAFREAQSALTGLLESDPAHASEIKAQLSRVQQYLIDLSKSAGIGG